MKQGAARAPMKGKSKADEEPTYQTAAQGSLSDATSEGLSDDGASGGDIEELNSSANTPGRSFMQWVEIPCKYPKITSKTLWVEIPRNTSDKGTSDDVVVERRPNANTPRSLTDKQGYKSKAPEVLSDEETSGGGGGDDSEWKLVANTSRSLADEGTSNDVSEGWRSELEIPGVSSDEETSDGDVDEWRSGANASKSLGDEWGYKLKAPVVSDEEASNVDAEDRTSKANTPRNISDEGTCGGDSFRWGSWARTPRRASDEGTSDDDDDDDEWESNLNAPNGLTEEWRNRVKTPGIISGEGTSDDSDEHNSEDNTSGSLSETTSDDSDADEHRPVTNLSSSLSNEGASNDDIVKWSPKINDTFFSIEEAVRQIKAWAVSEGFKMTIKKSEPRMKTLKCWCHGEPLQPKPYPVRKTKARTKGCLVQINVNAPLDRKGEAYISLFNDVEHTHPLNGDRGLLGSEADPTAQIKARKKAEKQHRMYIKRHDRERLCAATQKETKDSQREARKLGEETRKLQEETGKLQEETTKPKRKPGRPKKKAENGQLLLEAEELFSLLEKRRLKEPGWFVSKTREGLRSEPRRIFWMNPLQRKVYSRYHDIILHANAAHSSKAFRLALFAAVDNQGKSRVVACALVLGNADLDNEWILQQFLEASRGDDGKELVPKVILVDGALRMNHVLCNLLPDTHVVNCVRHTEFTLRRNLIGLLGKPDFKDFMSDFWLAQKSLTAGEFKEKWSAFLAKALLEDSRVEDPLRKAYESRLQWARFQVGLLFTAGLQGIQRVRSLRNLIGREISGKTPPLQDLFLSVQGRVGIEDVEYRHMAYSNELKVSQCGGLRGVYFPDLLEINRKYLGVFAREEIDKEMDNSIFYDISTVKIEEAAGWYLKDIPKLEPASQLGNGSDVEMEDDNNSTKASESGANKVDESTQLQGTSKASLALFLIELGLPKIEAVFEVTHTFPPKLKQYVILFKDDSHICTCLLLRNKGITCAHFFRAMKADERVRYHIRLIPRRWYHEYRQDDPNLEEEIRGLPFMISKTRGENPTAVFPGDNFLDDYLSIEPQSESWRKPQSKMNNSLDKRKYKGDMEDTTL
ncbi:hypothetical protein BGZ79_000406, partial [Entomortierella chlamydospora]